MKITFLTLVFVAGAFICHSQVVGVGFGTQGINIKSVPFHHFKLIGRVNPLYSSVPANTWVVNGNLMAGYNFLSEGAGDIYTGIGIGSASTEVASIYSEQRWFLNVPVGFELHPFVNKRISLAAEMGPRLDVEGNTDTKRFSLKGLIEFSFYL